MDTALPNATASGTSQAFAIVLNETTTKWMVAFFCAVTILSLVAGILALEAVGDAKGDAAAARAKAEDAYAMAQRSDMTYTLVYAHQLKMEAWLAARGAPVDAFGSFPPPTQRGHEK